MDPGKTKRFRCDVCLRSFTRNDHLKRHLLSHTGQKPYHCQFCKAAFARSDTLRDHHVDCEKRGGQPLPATGPSGRRRHACNSCISMKLRCDGKTPCGSCKRRKVECSKVEDTNSANPSEDGRNSETLDAPLDRGSIKFLLNQGSEGFTSSFTFPPSTESVLQQQDGAAGPSRVAPALFQANLGDTSFTGAPGFDFVDNNTFGDFFSGPFGFANGQDAFSSLQLPEALAVLESRPVSPNPEPEQPYAGALVQALANHVSMVVFDLQLRAEMISTLGYLLTTRRIKKFVGLYFSLWHPNARVLNQFLFDPATVQLPLLAAVISMGALYSQDQIEAFAARTLLDIVELYCFSTKTMSPSFEIDIAISGSETDTTSVSAFEELQAAYLMIVVQHWAGNKSAKNRAMEIRFGEVVKVARRQSLTRVHHATNGNLSEPEWLYTESRIRTMAYIVLIDCAFSFFQNYPCRLTHTELEYDLPSEEYIYASKHPFSKPGFCFSRHLTTNDAFEQLFLASSSSRAVSPSSASGSQPERPLKDASLTVLDLFVLIHLMYAFLNTYMTLVTSLSRYHKSRDVEQDTTVAAIKRALFMWRNLWSETRGRISDEELARLGFFKNGYSYWLVAHLLISKKDKVDSVMRMDFNEDKIEKLRLLLLDDGD